MCVTGNLQLWGCFFTKAGGVECCEEIEVFLNLTGGPHPPQHYCVMLRSPFSVERHKCHPTEKAKVLPILSVEEVIRTLPLPSP